jgi:hypothetical protein
MKAHIESEVGCGLQVMDIFVIEMTYRAGIQAHVISRHVFSLCSCQIEFACGESGARKYDCAAQKLCGLHCASQRFTLN